MITMMVLIAAFFGAWALYGRGCGIPGTKPAWLPDWLARNGHDPVTHHREWQMNRPVKVVLTGLAAAVLAYSVTESWLVLLVGLGMALAFAMGHSITPWRDERAYVLRLLDMAEGWKRGVWEGAISGALLVLPMAVWLAWAGSAQGILAYWPAAIVLLGGAAKPLCYALGGLISKRPAANPDIPASLLHGVSAWGAMAAVVFLAA